MSDLKRVKHDALIVGFDTSDDAAVYKLNDKQAIINTLDFFTPVVDDPYEFGAIAAANALSDIYAMGGQPILALNIVGFPKNLDKGTMQEILRGGQDQVIKAGAILAGGHTVEDKEPKYGLSVTGLVHPDEVVTNSDAQVGDVLILTKPLGSGILNTAIKGDLLTDANMREVIDVMKSLNKIASELMREVNVSSCTDITGFGLAGHSYEMAKASGVTIEFETKKLPVMANVIDNAEMGVIPAGAYKNRDYLENYIRFSDDVIEVFRDIAYDPQTSGGLLISLSEGDADKLMALYEGALETTFAIVGRVVEKGPHSVVFV